MGVGNTTRTEIKDMGESLNLTKEDFGRAVEGLKSISGDDLSVEELDDLVARIQLAQDVLVQNEKKIWLRTKKGREMLSEFSIAVQTLIWGLEAGSDPDGTRDAVSEVERQAKTLSDEIRKRSMVVT